MKPWPMVPLSIPLPIPAAPSRNREAVSRPFCRQIGSSVRPSVLIRTQRRDADGRRSGHTPSIPFPGHRIQLRCVARVPALAGLTLSAAQAALNDCQPDLGPSMRSDNQKRSPPRSTFGAGSVISGQETSDCRAPVTLAINTPPADPPPCCHDKARTMRAARFCLPGLPRCQAIRRIPVYSGSSLLKQLAGASINGTEIGGLANGVATRLRW